MTGSVTDGDVVQDALFRAYRNLDTYDDSRPLAPWLFRIAHNQCIDFLRRRGVRVEAESAAAEPDVVQPGDFVGTSIGPAMEHLVLNLPPKERACVLLKDVFDYSLEEIAELVDSTVGGVKAALNRGRAKLASSDGRVSRASTDHSQQILRLYVDRFNSRDWDGLRELIRADARLLVADRYSGSFADGGYLGVYSRMRVTWRLTLGDVDGEPGVILLTLRDGSWGIEGIVRLDVGEDGKIQRVADYQHCPWLLTAGSIVEEGSAALADLFRGRSQEGEITHVCYSHSFHFGSSVRHIGACRSGPKPSDDADGARHATVCAARPARAGAQGAPAVDWVVAS